MSAEEQVRLDNFDSIFSLDGKVAVVTGGSRGLGLHAASGPRENSLEGKSEFWVDRLPHNLSNHATGLTSSYQSGPSVLSLLVHIAGNLHTSHT
ncbi:hypothetical protein KXX43_000808 [Aspergillus fumigatus]|nr:hypothetical protein KXX43_000808 [Aspergillus fumigatus]